VHTHTFSYTHTRERERERKRERERERAQEREKHNNTLSSSAHTDSELGEKRHYAKISIRRSHACARKGTRMLYRPPHEIEGRSPSHSRQTCVCARNRLPLWSDSRKPGKNIHKHTHTFTQTHAHTRTRDTQQGRGTQTGVANSAIRLCRACQVSVAEN
jgi:hypothetical protein